MKSVILSLRKSINKSFLKVKPYRPEIETFKRNLIRLIDRIDESESEEFHKNVLSEFLKDTYYSTYHYINTRGRFDLVIHTGKDSGSPVGVLFETKKPGDKTEMPSKEYLNTKAFHELLLYYLRERITGNNLELKYLIATDIREWYIFNASEFEKLFAGNKNLVRQFNDFEEGRLSGTTIDFFYKSIAEPFIRELDQEISVTHTDIREYERIIRNDDRQDDNKLIALYKIFSPGHLLKLPFINDSNTLDKSFYSELLHIIGLKETKEGSKKLIGRRPESERYPGSLIENTINILQHEDCLSQVKPGEYGSSRDEQLYHMALELVITWINRILFLKLLEGQLLRYNNGEKEFRFLNIERIHNYDTLNKLFFQVLAVKEGERNEQVKQKFRNIPYLNSSLFEPDDLERRTIRISNLDDEYAIPILNSTVLRDNTGKRISGKMNTLQYLFAFLDAYDFASEGSEEIQEENKTLINASVLGLIFEKINGYKDGSFFTPGFITMYMCRETIRRAVVQKFNDAKGCNCETLNDFFNKIGDEKEANRIINSLKICDPAVGSGHFLVSALNEIIAIKSELKILLDRDGRRLKHYHIEVANDELVITDEDGELFEYNPKNKESQQVQEALFHEKQTIIENCLFGVDINPNSVKICRLRLWIELLKNAYYKSPGSKGLTQSQSLVGSDHRELETLPNIDINIKCGNSLISRYPLDADIKKALRDSRWSVDSYRLAVMTYRNAQSKDEKREMEKLIEQIKNDFESEVASNDKRLLRLNRLKGELTVLTTQTSMFEKTKAQKTLWEKEVKKLTDAMQKLEAELAEIRTNKIYENSFEWRFEFPEVLNDDGDFVGFDVVIGNPPYVRVDDIDKASRIFYNQTYKTVSGKYDLYYLFYEHSISILKSKGLLNLITPNRFTTTDSGQKLRYYSIKSFKKIVINSVSKINVFESAATYPAVIFMEIKDTDFKELWLKETKTIDTISNFEEIDKFKKDEVNLLPNLIMPLNSNREIINIYFSLRKSIQTKLRDFVNIQEGLRLPQSLEENYGDYHIVKQYQFERYSSILRGSYIKTEKLKSVVSFQSSRFLNCLKEKILIAEDGLKIEATLDETKSICQGGIYFCTLINDNLNLRFVLGLLNSKLFNELYKNLFSGMHMGGGYLRYRSNFLYELPLKRADNVVEKGIINKVDRILFGTKQNPAADTTSLEAEIDRMVYELYSLTEEEIRIVEGAVG
jgi:hypothetical protein